MKWFDRWLYNKITDMCTNKSNYEDQKYSIKDAMNTLNLVAVAPGPGLRGDKLDTSPDLNFKMFRAENGYVMEVRQHDRKTDRQTVNLHVITEEQDLGTAISHILTLESLRT